MITDGAITDVPGLLDEIRSRFAHVERCPFAGERIFFENAGGALTLKSVVETSATYAAIPDNQGRDNEASAALMEVIADAKDDIRTFLNPPDGDVFVGESGSELVHRLVSVAVLGAAEGGQVLSSTLEHPVSRSAMDRWAKVTGRPHVLVPHDDATGTVTAADYRAHLTPETRVATIVHTSPVTGMGVDMAAIAREIRRVSPECVIVVDGIQHASHGHIDVAAAGIDGYVISPYKVFSRHGYGIAWVSDRMTALPHDNLAGAGGPAEAWELGTRDTGAYATFSDVVGYFRWLGSRFTESASPRAQIEAAGRAIHAHEKRLTEAMLQGVGNHRGLAAMDPVGVIGGVDNPLREGLVSLTVKGLPAQDVVAALREAGIRTHTRKPDHYSGNILKPLGLEGCVRVSLCHYNSEAEVAAFLEAMDRIVAPLEA